MLNENLKLLRKQKGYSQEMFAEKINVVRQTVSKWEKGISVPDADMLIKIAEVFDVSVNELLGEKAEGPTDNAFIADRLSVIAEQLAIRNRRTKYILRIIAISLAVFAFISVAVVLLNIMPAHRRW